MAVVKRRPFRTRPAKTPPYTILQTETGEIAAAWEVAHRPVYAGVKRMMDFSLALAGIIALLPLLIAVAILIKLDSSGPVFFSQERLGRGQRPFQIIKFRSMYTRDIDLPPELIERNESSGPLFKIRNDPRVTKVGRFIRKTSIDELPQLINVVRGEMSLVGPRPPLPREIVGYETAQRLRLRVLPGVTGPWQVGGRSNLPFEEMVRLDLEYIDRRGLLLDAKLIVLTIPTILFGRGAC